MCEGEGGGGGGGVAMLWGAPAGQDRHCHSRRFPQHGNTKNWREMID